MRSDNLIRANRSGNDRDPGAVLLLVLAVSIVLSLIVLALANYVAADLRYSRIVDARAKTLSSAESGIEYAVGRMRLNQTLCSSDLADADPPFDGGPIGLDGSAAPTALPGSLNGAVTTLTCERVSDAFPAVAGWSVIATRGDQPSAISADIHTNRRIAGSVYVSDPSNIDMHAGTLTLRNGDVWHRYTACAAPLPAGALSPSFVVQDPFVRGPICTPAAWDDIVSAPPLPDLDPSRTDLDDLPLNDGSVFDDGSVLPPGTCRVFAPGHYKGPSANTGAPQIDPSMHVYFQSGDYWFDDVGLILIDDNAIVTVGGTPTSPTEPCHDARLADPNSGGTGATFYLSGTSRIRVDNGGSLEMFGRQQGNFFVSVQALSSADGYPPSTPGTDRALVRTRTVDSVHLTVRGLVWSPASPVILDNPGASAVHQLLGGVVAERLGVDDVGNFWPLSTLDLVGSASAAGTADIRLRATAMKDDVSTRVEAIVQYRPQATDIGADKRVTVKSFRVVG